MALSARDECVLIRRVHTSVFAFLAVQDKIINIVFAVVTAVFVAVRPILAQRESYYIPCSTNHIIKLLSYTLPACPALPACRLCSAGLLCRGIVYSSCVIAGRLYKQM